MGEQQQRGDGDAGDGDRALSTTVINGMIVCLRRIVEENKDRSLDSFKSKLKGVKDFKFGTYKSSQYGSLGRVLFDKYFA